MWLGGGHLTVCFNKVCNFFVFLDGDPLALLRSRGRGEAAAGDAPAIAALDGVGLTQMGDGGQRLG